MEEAKIIKKRSPRWTQEEIEALISGIEGNTRRILGTCSSEVPFVSKQTAWKQLAMQVNAVGPSGVNRTMDQVQHKWWDLKSAAKKIMSQSSAKPSRVHGGFRIVAQPAELRRRITNIISQQLSFGDPSMESDSVCDDLLIPTTPTIKEEPAASPCTTSIDGDGSDDDADNILLTLLDRPESPVTRATKVFERSLRKRKRQHDEAESTALSVQTEILSQITNLVQIQKQMLEQMMISNDLKRQKLDLMCNARSDDVGCSKQSL